MSDPLCSSVQESIAWTWALAPAEQDHVLSCEACHSFLEQITVLDATMASNTAVSVPEDFTSVVMSRVLTAVPAHPAGAIRAFRNWPRLARLWDVRPLRLAVVHMALALSVTNLFRFVFSLLIPSTTWGALR